MTKPKVLLVHPLSIGGLAFEGEQGTPNEPAMGIFALASYIKQNCKAEVKAVDLSARNVNIMQLIKESLSIYLEVVILLLLKKRNSQKNKKKHWNISRVMY